MNPRNPNDTGELVVRGRKPFAMIPTDLVRDPAISSSAVRLWTVLASYAYGSDVVTRPSRAALAGDCGYGSTRAVDLNLRQLARAGWLTIEPTRRADGGRPVGGRATARLVPGARFMLVHGMGHGFHTAINPEVTSAIVAHVKSAETR